MAVEKSDATVVIKNADKQLVRVAASDVQVLQQQPTSMMPQMLFRDLGAQEAADLLAYLVLLR